MQTDPACPVCGERKWLELQAREYSRGDARSEYEVARFDVLFEMWFPGADSITITTIACRTCGIVIFRPRPEADDIDRKYAHLNRAQASADEFIRPLPSDARRSAGLLRELCRHVPAGGRVLDFGGGNGRLLSALAAAGLACEVVDYRNAVPDGIGYAGADLRSVPAGTRYDAIVCSHVIEHVADPVGILRSLAEHVGDGILYVEVPSEIWRRPPPGLDPVTHINFFTRESLSTTLQVAGLELVSCRYATFVRPNGRTGLAVKAVARRFPARKQVVFSGVAPVMSLLRPSLLARMTRLLRHPRMLGNLLRR